MQQLPEYATDKENRKKRSPSIASCKGPQDGAVGINKQNQFLQIIRHAKSNLTRPSPYPYTIVPRDVTRSWVASHLLPMSTVVDSVFPVAGPTGRRFHRVVGVLDTDDCQHRSNEHAIMMAILTGRSVLGFSLPSMAVRAASLGGGRLVRL
jgi:hypothetical protein